MSFFTKAKGLFQLDNTVDKLKKQINECDKQLNNKQKLIDEIKSEAEKECEKTRRDAKNQAEEMVSSAAKKRDEIKNEISILESQRAEKTGQLAELTDTIAAFEKNTILSQKSIYGYGHLMREFNLRSRIVIL